MSLVKYSFFYEIIDSNHDFLHRFETPADFDSYIMLMNLYMYTCKYMNMSGIALTKDSIYQNMQQLYSNAGVRKSLTNMYMYCAKTVDVDVSRMLT